MRTWKAVAGKQVRLAGFYFLAGPTAAGGGVTRADLQLVSGVTLW